jgi:hypothetical protein
MYSHFCPKIELSFDMKIIIHYVTYPHPFYSPLPMPWERGCIFKSMCNAITNYASTTALTMAGSGDSVYPAGREGLLKIIIYQYYNLINFMSLLRSCC